MDGFGKEVIIQIEDPLHTYNSIDGSFNLSLNLLIIIKPR